MKMMARLKSDETKIQISNVSVEKRMRYGRNSTTCVYNPGGATAASFLTNVHPVPVFLFPRHVMAAMCALLPQPQRDNCRMRVPAARSWPAQLAPCAALPPHAAAIMSAGQVPRSCLHACSQAAVAQRSSGKTHGREEASTPCK